MYANRATQRTAKPFSRSLTASSGHGKSSQRWREVSLKIMNSFRCRCQIVLSSAKISLLDRTTNSIHRFIEVFAFNTSYLVKMTLSPFVVVPFTSKTQQRREHLKCHPKKESSNNQSTQWKLFRQTRVACPDSSEPTSIVADTSSPSVIRPKPERSFSAYFL